jgi:uncharacterized membrane protein YccF (DUF307 family)
VYRDEHRAHRTNFIAEESGNGHHDESRDSVSRLGKVEMKAIGNFIWFVFGGILMGLGWYVAGLIMFVTVIGIPWGKSCFVIGTFTFFPFGKEAISRKDLTGQEDVGTGAMGMLGNVVWFLLAGWWLAIGHLCSALVSCITIIGIPFGLQHLKLAGISLAPVGKTIVQKEVAEDARRRNAHDRVTELRGES